MIDQDLKETKQNISDIISSWTLEQKIGQLFFPAAYFNATQHPGLSPDSPKSKFNPNTLACPLTGRNYGHPFDTQ